MMKYKVWISFVISKTVKKSQVDTIFHCLERNYVQKEIT